MGNHYLKAASFSLFALLILSACGGSGGDSDPTDNTSPNTTPVSNAGSDQNVITGQLVELDGTGSSDADGDSLNFSWSISNIPSGSAITLSSNSTSNPAFTPDINGTYTFQLIVNDGTVNGNPDSVTIIASTPISGTAIFDTSTFDSGAVFGD